MSLIAGSTLLLAAAGLGAADRASVDAAVATAFQPYSGEVDATPVWERPIFSAEINALVVRWKAVMPEDEPDRLNDGDWLCLCQDWDAEAFRAAPSAHRRLGRNVAQVQVRIDLGHGAPRNARLIMKREGGQWRIDNIFASDFPTGLKQTIRLTIAEDQRLRQSSPK